jgi:hypothetical protein
VQEWVKELRKMLGEEIVIAIAGACARAVRVDARAGVH